jgi:CheY-like chemotaxis protein
VRPAGRLEAGPHSHGHEPAGDRRLGSDAPTRAIPVIALTAHALVEARAKAAAAGCDDFDTKPVELPRLLDKINKLLGQNAGGAG